VRVSFLVYGALYVVLEVVGYQLEQVGWADVSGLDVATALADAFLTVAVCAAVLVALDLGAQRWRPMEAWHLERAGLHGEIWDEDPDVSPWRQAPLTVSAERVAESPQRRSYTGNPYSFAGHRFPKDPGTLL
jgi:hypothetical protein